MNLETYNMKPETENLKPNSMLHASSSVIYDVVIIGAGPAGVAAAVYAARKKLKTLLITDSFGGQSIVSDSIQNWIGEPHISGFDLAKKLEEHVRSLGDAVEIKMPERATKIEEGFVVTTDQGNKYESKTIILVAGARRRKLNIPGEAKFEGKGVVYCSTCDAPLFGGKTVAVVGGGNAGLEAVVDLFPYAKKIYLIVRSDSMKGDPVTQEEIKKNNKVEIIYNALSQEILGEKFVSGLKYQDSKTNEVKTLDVDGVFVEIGSVPNSEIAKGLVEINQIGEIIVNSKHSTTSHPGIFAAGDITDDPYKQNNISVGDAVKAALAAYNYILKNKI